MPYYLMQESFPPNVWRSIVDGAMDPNPFSNPDVLNAGASILGGKVHSSWLSCENCEYLWIVEMPGNVDVTSMTIMNLTRGNTHPIRITPLLSPEEAVKAISIATDTLGYAETKGYQMDSGKTTPESAAGKQPVEDQPATPVTVAETPSLKSTRQLDVGKSVYDLSEQYPELIEILAEAGYTQGRNKLVRSTIGKTMSLKSTMAVIANDGLDLGKALKDAGFELVGGASFAGGTRP
jgi:hypothetical protein